MFNVSIPGFRVVAGSIWYMRYYFAVVLVNTGIMMFIQRSGDAAKLKRTYMYLLAFTFVWVSYGKYSLGLDLKYFLFYSFFWMLGMNRMGKTNSAGKFVMALAAAIYGFLLASYLQELPVWDIQSAKFPPTIKYGFASMPVILIAKQIECYMHRFNRILVHIGKNAIFYYFGQGIGSLVNYYVIKAVHLNHWFIKWTVTFAINVLITMLVVEFLGTTYKWVRAFMKKEKVTA